jgi:putative tricarboxylic transport membrane protein
MSEDVRSSGTGASPFLKNFRGGLTIAVLALSLLVMTFYITNPLVPRALAIALGVVGVGTAAGLIPVRAPQDFYGGLMLVWLAVLAMVASAELPGQRGFAFGPGTAPRLFSGLLAFIGAWVAAVGAFSNGPRIEKYAIRGPFLVILSIVLFATIIRPFGLVLASFLTFMMAITGSNEMRVIEGAIGAAAMTAFCVLLFVYLLNLPFQLWPLPNAFEILVGDASTFLRLIFGPLLKFVGVM